MENQILKAINHIKHISKENNFPVKIFNYLQNNGAWNYDYGLVVNKIQELTENGVIDQSYKIINPITEVLNISLTMKLKFVPRFQTVTILLVNYPNLIDPKHHYDDIEPILNR